MITRTAEQIAAAADHLVGSANIARINQGFRAQDTSNLAPINGRFDATERAIRRLRRAQRDGLVLNEGLEYAMALDAEITGIVNDPGL